MPTMELNELILQVLEDHRQRSIPEVVHEVLLQQPLYESEIKAALLGLIRRNRLELTENFDLRLPENELAAAV